KVVKNKLAPPFRDCEFDILYGTGASRSGDVLDLASEARIVEKSGAWYSYKSDRIGQGRDNARQFLEEHPEMLADIERQVLELHGIRRAGGSATAESDATKSDGKPVSDGKSADVSEESNGKSARSRGAHAARPQA
ncbi:MAG: DNA recombination/repair protein RecA, partial [Myxococcales bacterium]|nr:DNA recombination/repair protein RecA [Myxococcales bacterium]